MSLESPHAHMQGQTPSPKAEKSQAELRVALENRLHKLKPKLDDALAGYTRALSDGTFEDTADEPEGSGEKRKEALQHKIRGYMERAEGMRRQLDSGEPLTDTSALDTTAADAFLAGIAWLVPEGRVPEGAFTSPNDLDFKALAQDRDQTKSGEYTLNPETQGLDFETFRAFVPDLSPVNGKPIDEVMQYVVDTYGATHHIPGIEYWKWLIENPTATPPGMVIKDGYYYFLPGSVLCGTDGNWRVPIAGWDSTKWVRYANWLTGGWESNCRVVLLEK